MSELEWLDIFGDNLRGIIDEYGITQSELAEDIGVSEAAISNYIHKKKMPSIKTIINMAYALDMDIDELIDFDDTID